MLIWSEGSRTATAPSGASATVRASSKSFSDGVGSFEMEANDNVDIDNVFD